MSTRLRRCGRTRGRPIRRRRQGRSRPCASANREGFETVALRPRFVWGRGDTTLLPEMVETVEAGKWAWIGGGRNVTDTTHVDNVVEGLVLAAEKGRPGEAYFVTDGEPVVFREFVTALLQTQGVEPPGRSIPAWTAAPMARVAETAWKVLPLSGHAADDHLPLLALDPGVHDRHLQGPRRAGLRADRQPRAGSGGATRICSGAFIGRTDSTRARVSYFPSGASTDFSPAAVQIA